MALIFVLFGCGYDDPAMFLGRVKTKHRRSGFVTEINAFHSVGPAKIANPRTPEDFAINLIQEIHVRHQEYKLHLLKQGIIISDNSVNYSPENPFTYSPKKVLETVNFIKNEMSEDLKKIYLSKDTLPEQNSIPLNVIQYWAQKINDGNQMAVRWQQLIAPQINYWKKYHKRDVRGYMFLSSMKDLDQKLMNFDNLDSNLKQKIRDSILSMCLNNGHTYSSCLKESRDSFFAQKAFAVYYKFLDRAQENYNAFFKIQQKMDFLHWSGASEFTMNMKKPQSQDVASFFSSTVGRYWKLNNIFNLQIDFHESTNNRLASINILENTIAHVVNFRTLFISPTDLYYNPQTVAHEAGHLLGFPDCYLEYVDENTNEAVYYEINQHNIMCSLTGSVETIHYDEIKKIY
jgi:predicted DNA-binding WGR domain protein